MKFDSTYEEWFYYWCEELKELGYIKEFEMQVPFTLFEGLTIQRTKNKIKKTKTKTEEIEVVDEYNVLKPCTYTTDFKIVWTEKGLNSSLVSNLFDYKNTPIIEYDGVSYIEIKPVYDYKNSKQRTNILIKWLFQLEQIYINMIVPIGSSTCLFSTTFTPKKYSVTSTGKSRTINYTTKTVEEWDSLESVDIVIEKSNTQPNATETKQ